MKIIMPILIAIGIVDIALRWRMGRLMRRRPPTGKWMGLDASACTNKVSARFNGPDYVEGVE